MKKLISLIALGLAGSALLSASPSRAHDWVDYGPLKVNIRGWRLNRERQRTLGITTWDTNFINTRSDKPGYISVDCDRDRMSTTRPNGKWRRYRLSIKKNERNLRNDFCTAIRKNPLLFN